MPADKEAWRQWPFFAATVLIVAAIFGVIAYHVGMTRGIERGRSEEIALRDDVDRQLKDLGLCEWPHAFAKAHKCHD